MTKLSYIALTYACVLTLGICKFLPDLQYDSEFFNKLPLETGLQRKSRAIIRSVGSSLADPYDIWIRMKQAEALEGLLNGSQSPQGKRKRWIV